MPIKQEEEKSQTLEALSPAAQEILESILSLGTDLYFEATGLRCQPPNAQDLYALCTVLSKDPPEQELQTFLNSASWFLDGLVWNEQCW